MSQFRITKGRNIRLKGTAVKEIVQVPLPAKVAIQPQDFRGMHPRLSVKVDDVVKIGSPLLTDKANADLRVVSPVSGKIVAINRGEKRVLQEVVIAPDGRQDSVRLPEFKLEEVKTAAREKIISYLLEGGVWPVMRQRPFSKVANPKDTPKSIFVQAMSTEPLAADVDFVLADHSTEFQLGLDILGKLTQGKVHLCFSDQADSKTLREAQNVEKHQFSGPHPAGNVSTHIHYVDPINKGDIVWYLQAQDVLRMAFLFEKGFFPAERIVALTGEGTEQKAYLKTVTGVSVKDLIKNTNSQMRYLSGSVLQGKNVGADGFVGFYDTQVTVIPEGGERKLLGWLSPGFDRYTFSKTFVSSFLPEKEMSLDADKNGSDRAIVLNHIYDEFVPLDIMVNFLLRAVISGDIEESERLGILECDEEDFALCTFACPSKTDVGGIIREGLELIEREG